MLKNKFILFIIVVLHSSLSVKSQIAVYTTCTAPKTVALTFDDCPSTLWTSQVLSLLKSSNIKANFFVEMVEIYKIKKHSYYKRPETDI